MSSNNITITLTSLSTQRTDSIEISPSSTLSDLCNYAVALLELPNADNVILTKNSQRLYSTTSDATNNNSDMTLENVGIRNGDLIVVIHGLGVEQQSSTTSSTSSRPTTTVARNTNNSSNGGLDFSSLLSTMNNNSNNASSTNTTTNNNTLQFNLPLLSGSLFGNQMSQTIPIQWDGMTLDDAIGRNPNPDCFVQVLLDEVKHGNLMKELNYHNPLLARKLKNAGDLQNAANIWRQEMQKSTLQSTMSKTIESQKEFEMEKRLRSNPMDEEANAYFGEKIRKQNVQEQYRQMMDEFPESMGRVLMLYIDAKVNNHPIQAFVDSGAQATIMSSQCAEKCGLLHLLDDRFAGTAVGVGTGKILGRIHIVQLQIADHYFPCTITVMDSDHGLGDKNMDFLLGLDMLKRHRCNIDLAKNALVINIGGANTLETKFLHEKDLDEAKGGTRGFDAEKSNQEVEKMEKDEEESQK